MIPIFIYLYHRSGYYQNSDSGGVGMKPNLPKIIPHHLLSAAAKTDMESMYNIDECIVHMGLFRTSVGNHYIDLGGYHRHCYRHQRRWLVIKQII